MHSVAAHASTRFADIAPTRGEPRCCSTFGKPANMILAASRKMQSRAFFAARMSACVQRSPSTMSARSPPDDETIVMRVTVIGGNSNKFAVNWQSRKMQLTAIEKNHRQFAVNCKMGEVPYRRTRRRRLTVRAIAPNVGLGCPGGTFGHRLRHRSLKASKMGEASSGQALAKLVVRRSRQLLRQTVPPN
jgi:hypothetical protein